MLSHSTAAITIADGEITVDAERLALKLGLTAAALKAEMRKGNVSSVAETGIDEDVGRTRVTFRYRTRTWSVVVDSDGALVDRLSIMLVESLAPAANALPANTAQLSLRDLDREMNASGELQKLIGMQVAEPSTPEIIR